MPLFHVKGYRLEPAHVEEGLVLDGSESRMMQETTIHVAAGFEEIGHAGLVLADCCRSHWLAKRVSFIEIIRILDYFNLILSCLGLKSSLHQNVKEEANCSII